MRKVLLALMMVVLFLSSGTGVLAAPGIEETEYKGSGIVEMDFHGKVQYKNVKVAVQDTTGKSYTASITKKDNDDLTFKIRSFKEGMTYNYQISGIRKRGEKRYSTISGTITIPVAGVPQIESVEYKSNGRVEIEFRGKVQYKKAKVTVKDAKGKKVSAKISKKENDELTVKPGTLSGGTQYTITISGIRARGASGYTSITTSFTTPVTAKPSIESVEYEGKGYVEIDFHKRVQYKNAKVTVKDSSGKKYKAKITEKDGDDMTIKVTGIQSGKKYTFTISGIRAHGVGKYGSITGSFRT